MKSLCVGLVLLTLCFANSEVEIRGQVVSDPEAEWNRDAVPVRKDLGRSIGLKSVNTNSSILPVSRRVPISVIVSSSNDPKEAFKPEKGVRELPDAVKRMLLQASGFTTAPPTGGGTLPPVEVRCHIDRMYVRVRKSIFKIRNVLTNLKLGNCCPNGIYGDHYYFLYPLTAKCGFETQSNVDDFIVRATLRYSPFGAAIRDMPFRINIHCKYPRFFHSYKVGIYPKVQGGTVHKQLKHCVFKLIAKDEYGNEIKDNDAVLLGKMLQFEAKRAEGTPLLEKRRLYIDKCFLTTSRNPGSGPKYYVIEKGGCMMDSMVSERSKFLTCNSKYVQKFAMPTVVLNDSMSSPFGLGQKLFMHCEISWGPEKATESQKACTYNLQEKRWQELYDDDSVCACCDFACGTILRSSKSDIVTSHAWKVDWSNSDVGLDIGFEHIYDPMDS
ncbi:zona pellucida sperm-binding protein 3 [Takifugu rubripes]|uniref:zona pellucida sperm-binding protein 3 n=1 Tax=Takifugu rubripes TaxID=31033 RepID=UPI00003652ED|nr:zona pellucida sperm-binding protein 3-like [Takifugu rubripes]|eukprot:XP_011611339.1 PREDICTED: zona pellucida sperm-binding protein 3-like [Takifugu rubripes]